MDRRTIENAVKSVIDSQCEINSTKKIEEDWENHLFRGDYKFDSLDNYEIMYHIENELGMEIPDEVVWDFQTPKELCDYLETKYLS